MLFWLVFLPLLGGLVGWLLEAYLQSSFTQMKLHKIDHKSHTFIVKKIIDEVNYFNAYWVALLSMVAVFIIISVLGCDVLSAFYQGKDWLKSVDVEWIPLLGIRFHLVMDGLSVLMCGLSAIIVIIAVIYSRKKRPDSSGLFYFCMLFMTSSVMISFIAMDLFLWFFCWEAVAIPLYFLITLWGRRDSNAQLKINGANKFLIYTQVSSLLMLIAIISLALTNWQLTNQWTFDYYILMKTPISSAVEFWLMLGFLIAMIVRIPLVPFHNWFIDAHIESSTTGSIMISGLLINTAIYGLLRFVIPLFPNASLTISSIMMVLSLLTLFYVAFLCFNQSDIKRLIAYVHIGLMSLITASIYSGSLLALQGTILQLISASFAIVGLFMISGLLVERYLTRNINHFVGLKFHIKYLSTLTLFFILMILGVPGSANFIGSYMLFFGSYEYSGYLALFLIIGFILLSVSMIVRLQPIFYASSEQPRINPTKILYQDLFLSISILIILFFIGLHPQWVLDMSYPAVNKIQQIISTAQTNLIKGDV